MYLFPQERPRPKQIILVPFTPKFVFFMDKSDYRVSRYTRAKGERKEKRKLGEGVARRQRGASQDDDSFLRRALIAPSSPLFNSQPATVITRVLPRGVYVLLIMPDISSRRSPPPLSREPRFSQSRAPRCAPVRAPPCPRNFRPFRTSISLLLTDLPPQCHSFHNHSP